MYNHIFFSMNIFFHGFLLPGILFFPLLISQHSSPSILIMAEIQSPRPLNNRSKRSRATPNQTIVNDDRYINLESSNSSSVNHTITSG